MALVRLSCVLWLAVLAHARLFKKGSNRSSSSPLAEVYVINLEERVDKCRCMQHQLKHCPWPVHLFRAMNRESVLSQCPGLVTSDEPDSKKANMALVCSNKLIWERFLHESNADHLVVFEDDAAILDTEIWNKLGSFLKQPCAEWDYLLVDPWGHGPWKERTCHTNFRLFDLVYGQSGSHLQVFHRRAVKRLATWSNGDHHAFMPVMDKLVESFYFHQPRDSFMPFAVKANITTQAMYYNRFTGQPLACETSVTLEEDRMKKFDATGPGKKLPFEC